ncbi:alpha/beta hydrolase fold-3 domain-containing protein [Ilyonectria destructans]|nr:alpha/beta hydrolase fold-3 domain-containing protein [Ilyonectria destructans]
MSPYDSKEAVAKLGDTNPDFAEYLEAKKNDMHPVIKLPFSALVDLVRQHPLQEPPTSDHESVVEIPMRDGYKSKIRIHKPASSSVTGLLVLLHGGGFCLGHNANVSVDSRVLASLYSITVVNISYRLAPEYKFPTAPNDVWDTLSWLTSATNAQNLGIELSEGLFIGGVSAGANLAAVTAQRWVTEKLQPAISGVWLNTPMLLDTAIVPENLKEVWFSREQNADAMIIDEKALHYIKTAYAPDVFSPQYSPFNVENAHKGLPPVYIQVCGQDPLRDDGLVYERVLRENGVQTKLDVYPGVPHGFADLFEGFSLVKECQSDILKGFGWLLGKTAREEGC